METDRIKAWLDFSATASKFAYHGVQGSSARVEELRAWLKEHAVRTGRPFLEPPPGTLLQRFVEDLLDCPPQPGDPRPIIFLAMPVTTADAEFHPSAYFSGSGKRMDGQRLSAEALSVYASTELAFLCWLNMKRDVVREDLRGEMFLVGMGDFLGRLFYMPDLNSVVSESWDLGA